MIGASRGQVLTHRPWCDPAACDVDQVEEARAYASALHYDAGHELTFHLDSARATVRVEEFAEEREPLDCFRVHVTLYGRGREVEVVLSPEEARQLADGLVAKAALVERLRADV